jgi:hypothetical protein
LVEKAARRSLESSFAQFQADRAVVGLTRQIRKNETLIAELMKDAQCHLGDFSEYARLRRSIKGLKFYLVVVINGKHLITANVDIWRVNFPIFAKL